MTIFLLELRRGKVSLIIWTAILTFLLVVCVFMFPAMSSEMADVSNSLSNMEDFTGALGMSGIDIAQFSGYIGMEFSNVMGMGGAFFAALLGIASLSKEERNHTAEFLLTTPVSRARVITEKLLAVISQILILNIVVAGFLSLSVLVIGEELDTKAFALLLLANVLLQIEIALITFGISAFLRRGSLGIGLGLAACFYFLGIISNLMEDTKFLKYITPFGYTDSGSILTDKAIDGGYLAVGMTLAVIGVAVAYIKYTRKDIA